MIKPDNCKRCSGEDLVFVKNNTVFNPDTDEYEKLDTWCCNECKTIHVDNGNISFFDVSIDTNKEYENKNMQKWMN